MDPLLIVCNAMVAGIGISIFAASRMLHKRWLRAIVQTSGVVCILAAVLALPSRALQSVSEETAQNAPADDDSSTLLTTEEGAVITDEASGNTVIITRDQSLVALLTRAIQGEAQEEAEVASVDDLEEESDSDERPARDPFGPAHPIVEDDLEPMPTPLSEPTSKPVVEATPAPTPSPTPAPTPSPAPARERTLPQESDAPSCTGFVLLHGTSGGPEPDGCYAVGCQEGYALPMQLQDGAWNACPNYSRLPRLRDCYLITDHDGSQRSMRFNKGSWKPGTCS